MENKVGIITVYGENNYGNKLQNYASIKIYESLGYKAETIKGFQSRLDSGFKGRLKNNIKGIICIFPKYKKYKNEIIREKKFKTFSKKYLNTTNKISLKNNNKKILESYKYLSIGSDQVWNDTDFSENDLRYFLAKDSNNNIKIALSPSIGKEHFKQENEKYFYNELKKFSSLSCREISGCNYIKKLTKRDCEVLIDPTLFLNKEEWKKIEKKPEWLKNNKFIFSYFLGGMPQEIEEKFSSNEKNILIDIMNKKNISYTTSPEEFIYLIHHSELVLTDSFHACVFSIIFNKKFTIFERIKQNCKMTSRIESLFNLFEQKVQYETIIVPCEWKNKEQIIKKEQDKMKQYLKKTLDIKE